MKLTTIKKEELIEIRNTLINDPEYTFKGSESSLSHIKAIIYDWNIENNWDKTNAFIFTNPEKTVFICFTLTKMNPVHCTLRHFVTLESERGKGVGKSTFEEFIKYLDANFPKHRLRFFVNIPAINFYKKQGFDRYHGLSKTKMPFYYGDTKGNLIHDLPNAQKRYVAFPHITEDEENLNNFFLEE